MFLILNQWVLVHKLWNMHMMISADINLLKMVGNKHYQEVFARQMYNYKMSLISLSDLCVEKGC